MIGLRIGTAELAEIEAGAPAVVLAEGVEIGGAEPLVPLVLEDGVLVRLGEPVGRSLPLPPGTPLLAVIAPDGAERLRAVLPPGIPLLTDGARLTAMLAEALRDSTAARQAAEAECDRLRRALGALAAPRPRRVLDLAPVNGTGTAAPLAQPLGLPAEGICTIELHLAAPGSGGLRVRLMAEDRIVGRWHLPEGALAPGWIALDLPEPATGEAEAVLELIAEEAAAPPLLTLAGDEPQAGIAIRVCTAAPGWSALPRHFDWSARDARLPAGPMPVPEAMLAAATVGGARAELVASGGAPAPLLVELPAEGTATIALPPLPAGPADLLSARLTLPAGATGAVAVSVHVAGAAAEADSGWRAIPAGDGVAITLPLPPGAMIATRFSLRHGGDAPVLVEIAGLALIAGAAGQPRRAPPPEAAAAPLRRPVIPVPFGHVVAAWRDSPPLPNVGAVGGPAAPAALPSQAAAALRAPPLPAGITAFQQFRLYQHLDGATANHRHIDIGLTGLVAPGGLWRQVRLKLFDRRGVAGLEFRQAKGWPMMFDTWPKGGADAYGPFWRLETEGTAATLATLATPHDRALVAAILEVLPEIADRAARAAKLDRAAAAGWANRARMVADAVAEARGLRGTA